MATDVALRERMSNESATASEAAYLESLKRERDRFVALAFCAADILLEVNTAYAITYAAGATKALTGASPAELTGRSLTDIISPADRPLFGELVRGMSSGKRLDPISVRLAGTGGLTVPLLLTGYHLPELPNSFFFALRLGASSGIAGQPDHWHRDKNTGLLQAESFVEAAVTRVRQGSKKGEDLKLTMLRLADFGSLRSRLNQEASDSLLETVGACLRVSSGSQETAARFDDENYGLIHKRDLDVDDMTGRIELHTRNADPQGVGLSVKAGTVPAALGDSGEADQVKALLYTVTQFCEDESAEPTVASLTENLQRLVNDAARKMSHFREIVSAENFDVAFQPIVRIDTREVQHFEALARFSGGSQRSPYELITFAENTGLISDFDYAMCRKLLGWIEDNNRSGNHYTIAMNLSGRSIGKPSFLAALQKLLAEHENVREQLVIEITESARITDLTMANNFIQSLRRLGHVVCLDDFGAGAAAFKYLHDIDVDIVKIDGQYIQGAVTERKIRPFLRAIVGLCGELGIATVAEMVEDDETVGLLRECRIELGQGFLFGKPSTDITVFQNDKRGAVSRHPAAGGRRKRKRAGSPNKPSVSRK